MNNLLRYLRQNNFRVVKIVLIILFILLAIQLFNMLAKNSNEKNAMKNENITVEKLTTLTSAIDADNDKMTTETKSKYQTIIEEFIKTCNNGDYESAYKSLSADCRQLVFDNSYDKFKSVYIKGRYDQKKQYKIQSWNNNVFMVNLYEDMLSTGKNTVAKQEYISVNGDFTINVGDFLGSETINQITDYSGLSVNVMKRYIFMDYEIYDVAIKNNGTSKVLMDDLTNSKTIYLLDTNNVKHYYMSGTLTKEMLEISTNETIKIKIKFSNPYISTRKITNLVFSNVQREGNNKTFGVSASV